MMWHRRTSPARRQIDRKRILSQAIEPLEARQLLTTLSTIDWMANPPGVTYTTYGLEYSFKDAAKNQVRITLNGNVTAEFVAASLDENNFNAVTLGDLTPWNPADDVNGTDLFAIYVTTADLTSSITVTSTEKNSKGGYDLRPFEGSIGDLRVNSYDGNKFGLRTKAMPEGTGKAFLGARTKTAKVGDTDQKDSDLIPITSATVPQAIGLLDPAEAGAVWTIKNSDGSMYYPSYEPLPGDPVSIRPGLYVKDGVNLGKFLFGGTVTGKVYVGGAMDTFYAGLLLTGETDGVSRSVTLDQGTESYDEYYYRYTKYLNDTYNYNLPLPSRTMPRNAENFVVKGDLRDLIVKGAIGARANGAQSPDYVTRFESRIAGRVGQVRSYDAIYGQVYVGGATNVPSITTPQVELEYRIDGDSQGDYFTQGYLVSNTFYNDSRAAAQYLGSISSASMGQNNVVQVQGILDAVDDQANVYHDWADYYAVGLMAGQTVDVFLTDILGTLPEESTLDYLRVGVFDPDGRLIITNYSDIDSSSVLSQAFRFVTDRPGIYTFAVSLYGDIDFATHGQYGVRWDGDYHPYELRITGVNNVTLGGVVAPNTIYDFDQYANFIQVDQGDLGAVRAGGSLLATYKSVLTTTYYDYSTLIPGDPTSQETLVELKLDPYTIQVNNGNLRTMEASEIGTIVMNRETLAPDIKVPKGSVGLVRSTTGILVLNWSNRYEPGYGKEDGLVLDPELYPLVPAVGGNYQVIEAADTFLGCVVANGGLGVLRAGNMSSRVTSYSAIVVNADLKGGDGIIDMIDVAGDFGRMNPGGPHITTGPGGNLRYLNVGGAVYADSMFGGGQPQGTTYPVGMPVTLNDDSGSQVTFIPQGGSAISVLGYGIRGSGGVAIVRVTTGGNTLQINGSALAANGSVEIGRVDLGNGPAILNILGNAKLDVFTVTGGAFTTISNLTKGEMVNMAITSVDRLTAESLGIARGNTGAVPMAQAVRLNNYPFNQQRNAIVITGAANIISTRGAMGNISAGSINQIIADSDSVRASGTFDGIVGPIYASGAINLVDIGAGVAPGGSGNLAMAGIFAGGALGTVRGISADIRGPIYSGTRINTIQLTNGSLINMNILVSTDILDIREIDVSFVNFGDSTNDGIYKPDFEIGSILIQSSTATGSNASGNSGATPAVNAGNKKKKRQRVVFDKKGNIVGTGAAPTSSQSQTQGGSSSKNTPTIPAGLPGGMIGVYVGAADIGTVKVAGGFGILNGSFATPGDGVIERIEADGYGLRDLDIAAGSRIGALVAAGTGAPVATTKYSASVRNNPNVINPNLTFAPNRLTDLNVFLGTTDKKSTIKGVTETGVISGVTARASRELDLLQAFRLTGGTYRYSLGESPAGQDTTTLTQPNVFNFANAIKQIYVTEDVRDTQITTGGIQQFNIGRDVLGLDMTVAGRINSITVKRNFAKDAKINATGPNGQIDSVVIGGNMAGTIEAQYKIVKASVRGKVTGSFLVRGKKIKVGK